MYRAPIISIIRTVQKEKIAIGVGVGIVLALLISIVGYGVWKSRTKMSARSQTSQAETSNDTSDSLLNVKDGSGVPIGDSSGNSIGLQTDLGQQKSQSNNFSEYEKYKDEKNSLYADIEVGSGKTVDQTSKVALLYKGYLTDGTLVDESKPAQTGGKIVPLQFKMGAGQVIPGIETGTYGMKLNGKRRIIIPPKSAYGDHSYGPIPPNSVLVFDVELVHVE